MDDLKNLNETSSLTKNNINLNSTSKIITNDLEIHQSSKKQNSKKICLSNKTSQNDSKFDKNQIQLTNLNSNNINGIDTNQIKIDLQTDSISLKSNLNKKSTKSKCKRMCNIKKINRKALKRPLPCLFAWTLLISSTGAYYSILAPRLLDILDDFTIWVVILSSQSVLFLYVVVNFLIAIFRDPGRFQKVVISPDDPNYNDDTKSPLYKTVVIRKTTVKIKWCSTCNFYRPPRVSHCSICDACIDQFDHHCPWLNNCVGKRNYRFFFQFLGFLCLHMCAIFSCCLTVTLKTIPVLSPPFITSIALMIVIVLLIFPIGGLFLFHVILVSKGRTTNEHVTGKYKGSNFFSRGCCMNFLFLFYGSLMPKYQTVKLKSNTMKKFSNQNDIESGDGGDHGNVNKSSSSSSESGNECQNEKDKQRLTVTYSNNNNKSSQEQELLDLVLKNKKNMKNNRKTSISSDSSISSSMLNKSSRLNQINNVSIDSNKLSTNNSTLNNSNLKSHLK